MIQTGWFGIPGLTLSTDDIHAGGCQGSRDIDARGRLFGRWNLIDAFVGMALLGVAGGLSYGAYTLFRLPVPIATTILTMSCGDGRWLTKTPRLLSGRRMLN